MSNMGKLLGLLALGLCVCSLAPRFASCLAQDADDEKKAIRKVLDDQVIAWNKGDLPGFMEGYWNSPDLRFYSGKDISKGWQATLDRYRKKYQTDGKKMGQLSFKDLDIEVLGPDAALVRGRFEVVLPEEKLSGLFTLICRKMRPGWRIVHDHTS
jgi:beta-aspartyl-peptidase (threonine type)